MAGREPDVPTILVTDRSLNTIDVIDGFTNLDVTIKADEPDSGTVDVPARPEMMALLQPGNRIVLIDSGEIFTAGPIEKPGPYNWGVGGGDEGSEASGAGTVTVSWGDDSALIAGRTVYPDPAKPASSQKPPDDDPDADDPGPAWTYTGPAGTAMTQMVNLNAGPGALANRRIPRLVIGDGAGLGSSIKVSERFTALGDALRAAATAGNTELGFRTRQVDRDIIFEVFEPTDRSDTARFSRGLGNLRSVTYDPSAPTATTALVAGQGEGSDRQIVEVSDADAVARWWRLEEWVDRRDTNDTDQLTQAGRDKLAEDGEQVQLATVTVDTEDLRFGRDFGLLDRVSVEVYPAAPGLDALVVTDLVRSAHLQYTPKSGRYLSVVVGSQEATSDPAWVTFARRLARRLAHIERQP